MTDESQLWFNRSIYVDRIAQRLSTSTRAQHVALCGEYGSGKSSVTRLVEKKLKSESLISGSKAQLMPKFQMQNQTWLTININSWSVEPDAIGSHILRQILNELSQYIDISAFSPLPENYRNALKAKGGWLNFLYVFFVKISQYIYHHLQYFYALFISYICISHF